MTSPPVFQRCHSGSSHLRYAALRQNCDHLRFRNPDCLKVDHRESWPPVKWCQMAMHWFMQRGDTNSGGVSRWKAITPASKANSTWHFCRRCWRQTARDSPFLMCAKKAWNGDACSVLTKSSLHDLMWWVWVCLQNDVAKWLKHGARMDPQHWSLLGIYLYLPGSSENDVPGSCFISRRTWCFNLLFNVASSMAPGWSWYQGWPVLQPGTQLRFGQTSTRRQRGGTWHWHNRTLASHMRWEQSLFHVATYWMYLSD